MTTELDPVLKRFGSGWPACVDCGPGWTSTIVALDLEIAKLDPHYELHQVKEKFGMLRYYFSCDPKVYDQAYVLVGIAEEKSGVTCEICGQPGHARTGGWIKTLCDACLGVK